MSYSKFTLSTVTSQFDLVTDETQDIFAKIQPVEPSNLLTAVLNEQLPLASAINTEKARSELIIMPLLIEVRRRLQNQIAIFSGTSFEVDPAQGLEGRCDFMLSRSPEQYYIAAPILTIIEAKNENIPSGLGQCIATMLAARLFNERAGKAIDTIYGAVTTGSDWKFLKLSGDTAFIDINNYFIKEVDKILGILVSTLQLDTALA
ncbi:hypothetical protein PN498_00300 [Oscillatoria sp. CS-180]|uniref:hypothetical protein n=1 Tax=Oscillatoria sp. CS-180 TaxID=3021720 RepID=UPI00232B1681|nr:hypothetical protein [Oscillatoria sp. CS-180]MDB9524411.1 hypothetical protein [Oscillatoria sp. CS-180]